MFTYVALVQITEQGREHLEKAPEYLQKITTVIESEGGELENWFAVMGPYDFITFVKYPDNEAAFRALAKIARFEVVKTETFPAEPVELFWKALV